jgi:hypothetical protein
VTSLAPQAGAKPMTYAVQAGSLRATVATRL